jgi:hypothetical protein
VNARDVLIVSQRIWSNELQLKVISVLCATNTTVKTVIKYSLSAIASRRNKLKVMATIMVYLKTNLHLDNNLLISSLKDKKNLDINLNGTNRDRV